MANSQPKRPKAAPPRLNLEEMEHDPSMRGMLSFLEISPTEKLEMLRRRAQVEAAENPQAETIVLAPATTVPCIPASPVPDVSTDTVLNTVAVNSESTIAAAIRLTPAALWCAEGNAGVFPNSRVRRIVSAEDALTRTERAVYDILWGTRDSGERERLSSGGYDVVARQAGVTKMNAKRILERLIEKGFLKVETLPDPLRRIPTCYRVFSYSAALERMARSNRSHVVRTGNGILFAYPLTATVVAGQPATVPVVPVDTAPAGPGETVADSITEGGRAGQS